MGPGLSVPLIRSCLSPFLRAIRVIRFIRDPPCILHFRAGTGAPPLRFYPRILYLWASTGASPLHSLTSYLLPLTALCQPIG